MCYACDAGSICSRPPSRRQDIARRVRKAVQQKSTADLERLVHWSPDMRPSAQDTVLELWPEDAEALYLPPLESQPPRTLQRPSRRGQAVVRPKRRAQCADIAPPTQALQNLRLIELSSNPIRRPYCAQRKAAPTIPTPKPGTPPSHRSEEPGQQNRYSASSRSSKECRC